MTGFAVQGHKWSIDYFIFFTLIMARTKIGHDMMWTYIIEAPFLNRIIQL